MEEESFERASADLEIIQAAYPEELTAHNDTPTFFPLKFTLNLTEHAFVTMELQEGYPTSSGVQISSYRSRPDEKSRMEVTVSAIRRASLECQEEEMEGGITCCSTALESWNDYDEGKEPEPESEKIEAMPKVDTNYEWISGEPLVDKKSTFQAHLCRLNSEQQVHEALHQLITGSSKIRRASHNMYAWRVSETMPDGRILTKHDNDDDGEDAAGSKLAYLLDMRKDENVLVVVSRWYGGIHLGPKRFAHIINVARVLLLG